MAGAIHHLQTFVVSTGVVGGEDTHKHTRLDSLWEEFFRAPSKWWDDRSSKRKPQLPDFRHKVTKEPLWMIKHNNPSWVKDELVRRGYPAGQLVVEMAGTLPPSFIWTCIKSKDLLRGTRLHHEIHERGLDEKRYSDALITMYAKCGELEKAQALLDVHNSSNVVPWSALIAGYTQKEQGENALKCFEHMQSEGVSPNGVTYASVLKACTLMKAIDKGRQFHDEVLRQGLLEHNIELGNTLVDMYAKCGALSQADTVLKELPKRDVISWTTLIAGYTQEGQGQQALKCFEQMQHEGVSPNARTYTYMLRVCAATGAFDKGKQIHVEISRQRLLKRRILGDALVEMYVECGALSQALSVVDNYRSPFSWGSLIAGYVLMGQVQLALECFEEMEDRDIPPDIATYVCLLKACTTIRAFAKGRKIHRKISRQGLLKDNEELGGALADMYAKCDALAGHNGPIEGSLSDT